MPFQLLGEVVGRLRDRKPGVRREAVAGLLAVFRAFCTRTAAGKGLLHQGLLYQDSCR